MRTIRSVGGMQRQARQWRRGGVRVALVPTMGSLHEGHLSLVHKARQQVGRRGKVVLSIYVNPTQFGPAEDFQHYPRDLASDSRQCRAAGVDVLFAPADREMYPGRESGQFSTYVVEERLSQGMEGAARPGHFRGVTTVVAKLFNLVLPDIAIFGAKDFQQAAVVQRMVADLNFPVRILVAPTRREPDGLAMSSRNQYLHGELRTQARVLWEALRLARRTVRNTPSPLSAEVLKRDLTELIQRRPAARVDYIAFFEPGSLQPVKQVGRGTHLALAVRVGPTRLIDNVRL